MPTQSRTEPPSSRRDATIAVAIVILALLLRLPALFQSLWYDEMVTLVHYVNGSWSHVFVGQYSPNNHVLFTVFAKLLLTIADALVPLDIDSIAFTIRLPSLIAGAFVPLVLAWPLRKTHPLAALLLAILTTLHPWLIASSANARGYALLLLLAILSTNFLPTRKQPLDWKYSLLLLLTVYTQPIGVGVALGHGATMLLLRRDLFATWFRSAAVAGIVTIALYYPMFSGARDYWTAPEKPSVTYIQFLDQAFRHAQAGYDARGIIHLLTPLLILIVGPLLAWRNKLHVPALITFTTASVFGLLVPLAIPLAGEVRALHWLIPLYALCATAILTSSVGQTFLSATGAGAGDVLTTPTKPEPVIKRLLPLSALLILLITLSLHTYAVLTVPNMPIREAVARARTLSPNQPLIGLYMASPEARALYAPDDMLIAMALDDRPSPAPNAPPIPGLRPLESQFPSPTLIVFYESFIARDEPELWKHLQAHYELLDRLPGRVSPAAIYRRRQ